MNYDTTTLKASFESAKYNEAYYSIFFAEADKYLRNIIPTAPQTIKVYKAAEVFFTGAYDYDDLIQDCLLKLWEQVVGLNLYHTDGITTYLINLAKFEMADFIEKQSRRNRIATTNELDINTPFFDGFDDEEMLTEVVEQYKDYEPGEKKDGEKVVQVEKKTYKVVATFNSISEAAKATGINRANISSVLSGRGKTAGGFIWIKDSNPLFGAIKNV